MGIQVLQLRGRTLILFGGLTSRVERCAAPDVDENEGRLRRVRSNASLAFTSLETKLKLLAWHLDRLGQYESGAGSNVRHSLQVAKAPLGILRTKIEIELRVALRSMSTETTVGPVEEQDLLRREQSLRAFRTMPA
jgi:hypothetical protein